MKIYLLDKANYFFPKNLNGFDDCYMEKIEIKRLNEQLKSSIDNEYKLWIEIINNFNKNNKYKSIDYTNFLLNQPSLHFRIMIENDGRYLKTLNLYSSLVIPFYYFSEKIYDNIKKCYVGKELINNFDSLDNELINIIHEVELKFKKKILEKEFLTLLIPNISFEEIQEGNFTVMNAFFNPKEKY